MYCETLIEENKTYWTKRAPGYSEVVEQELISQQKDKWNAVLSREIQSHFSERRDRPLKVLDIGTGPGFFALLLAEQEYEVTAIDLIPEMLEEAKRHAGKNADSIRFIEMNAETLLFEDCCFDLVTSRNLTWNLPHPETAYREWTRVLKPGGLMINFDANWYRYLFDDSAKKAYETDRRRSAEEGIQDLNIGENFDVMEAIAGRIPLSRMIRPAWDLKILSDLGMSAEADPCVYETVWSDEEKVNFHSTPMFMITAVKPV